MSDNPSNQLNDAWLENRRQNLLRICETCGVGLPKCDHCKSRVMTYEEAYWTRVVKSAKKRSIEIGEGVDVDHVFWLLGEQDHYCALSGVPIVFASNIFDKRIGFHTASLDRIDSSLGYVKGNLQWIHKMINRMKSDLKQEAFVFYCKLVASHASAKTPEPS